MTPSFRHRVEYRMVAIVRGLIRKMPEVMVGGTGAMLGRLVFLVDRRHRQIAERQLQAAFPRKSPAECRAIARATFVHFGRLLVSVLSCGMLAGVMHIIGIVEGIIYLTQSDEDFVRTYVQGRKGWL